LTFVLNLLRDYGLNDFYLELSTKNPEKFVGEDSDWAEATEALRKAATAQNLELVLDEGGAAFYGPKISVQAKDAIGRISADLIAPYPPGVAVVAPGELLTEQIVNGLAATQKAGVRIAYASDATLATYRVTR
jgi:arginine/lysine/ornithine decarboxylase